MMRAVFLFLVLASAFALPARSAEGTVETRAGAVWTGQIRLSTNRITIANLSRVFIVEVPVTNLLELRLESFPPAPPPPGQVSADRWQAQHVGNDFMGGRLETRGHLLNLSSSGLGFREQEDSFYWACQPLSDDEEISGRLLESPRGGKPFQAGLMIREDQTPGACYVFVGWTRQGLVWQCRELEGAPLRQRSLGRSGRWFRLKRDGNWCLAYASTDGRRWTEIERVVLDLPPTAPAGFALAGAALPAGARVDSSPQVSATFDQARMGRGLRLHSFMPRLMLRSGSQLVEDIAYADAYGVRLAGTEPWPDIPWSRIAELDFQYVPSRWIVRLRNGRPGALLANGEFHEGEPKQLKAGTFLFSSVLFGLRRFDAHHEVVAVVTQSKRPATGSCEVRTWNGSILHGALVQVTEQGVWLQETDLGRVHVPFHSLRSLALRGAP